MTVFFRTFLRRQIILSGAPAPDLRWQHKPCGRGVEEPALSVVEGTLSMTIEVKDVFHQHVILNTSSCVISQCMRLMPETFYGNFQAGNHLRGCIKHP
jgi:hypothetical protein